MTVIDVCNGQKQPLLTQRMKGTIVRIPAFVSVWIHARQLGSRAGVVMVSTRSNKKNSKDVENSSNLPDRKRAKLSAEGDGPSSNPRNVDESIFATQVTSKARGIGNQTDNSTFYLFKSEPEPRMEKGIDVSFSIDDLAMREGQVEPWDGVRNYEARNTMQRMRAGEYGFFYVSLCSSIRPLACEVFHDLSMYLRLTFEILLYLTSEFATAASPASAFLSASSIAIAKRNDLELSELCELSGRHM
jgi:hypothetical protein